MRCQSQNLPGVTLPSMNMHLFLEHNNSEPHPSLLRDVFDVSASALYVVSAPSTRVLEWALLPRGLKLMDQICEPKMLNSACPSDSIGQ